MHLEWRDQYFLCVMHVLRMGVNGLEVFLGLSSDVSVLKGICSTNALFSNIFLPFG